MAVLSSPGMVLKNFAMEVALFSTWPISIINFIPNFKIKFKNSEKLRKKPKKEQNQLKFKKRFKNQLKFNKKDQFKFKNRIKFKNNWMNWTIQFNTNSNQSNHNSNKKKKKKHRLLCCVTFLGMLVELFGGFCQKCLSLFLLVEIRLIVFFSCCIVAVV